MARERFSSSEDELEKINKRASTDRKEGIKEKKMIREVLKTGNVSVPEKEIEENQINEEDVQPEIEVPAEVLKVKEPRLEGEFFGGAARIKEGNKQTKKEEARPLEKKEVIKGEKGEEPQKPAESQIKQEKIKEDKESQIKEVKRALIFAIENGRNEKEIELWKNKLREFSGEDQLSPEELTGCIRNFIGNLKIKLEKLNPEEPKEELIRISNLESMADQRIFGCPEGDRACQELYKEIKNLRTLYAEIRGKQKEEPKMEKSEIEQPKINKETATAEKEIKEKQILDRKIENNALPGAKELKQDVANLVNFSETSKTESDFKMIQEQLDEIFYRNGIESPDAKDVVKKLSKQPLLASLLGAREGILIKEKAGGNTPEKIDRAKKVLKSYLENTFGVTQIEPKEGDLFDKRIRYYKVIEVKKCDDPALDSKIAEVKTPGYKIGDELWDYYKGDYQKDFNVERERREEVLRELKKKGDQELFDKAYESFAKWKDSHTFSSDVKPSLITVYKFEGDKKVVEQVREKEKAAEQKRLEEIEKRPEPQKNEALEDWLTRMGGPYGRVEKLEMCSKCGRISLEKGCKCSKEQMKSTPLIIDSEGNLLANGENVNKYFDVTKLADEAAKKNPNIAFIFERGGEWGLKKELFGRPDAYLHFIRETLKKKREIVVSKDFQNKVMRDWYEAFYKGLPNYPENFPNFPDKKLAKKEKPAEAGKEKVEEKPKKKERPEKKKPEKEVKEKPKKKEKKKKEEKPKPEEEKKPLTLDEQIAQKQKELEEVEMKHNIYYSPVVRDLLGLYYDKRLKDLRKEMKELGKEKKKKKPSSAKAAEGKEPKEMHEKSPTAKEYLTHIKGTDKLFNEMTKARWEVKKKKGKETRLKYEKAKKEWQDAYKKTLAMEGRLNPKVLEKISKILEKERAKAKKVGLLRKIWSFFKLVAKKFGKEVIEEVKHDVLEKQLETVKQRIKQGGVLGRATLEKEQKRLEKRLKKLKKK